MDSAFYMGPDQANIVSGFLHLHQHLFDTCGIIMNYNTNYYLMKLSKQLKVRCYIGMDILKFLFVIQQYKIFMYETTWDLEHVSKLTQEGEVNGAVERWAGLTWTCWPLEQT